MGEPISWSAIAIAAAKAALEGAAVGGAVGGITGGPQGALKGALMGAGTGGLIGGASGAFPAAASAAPGASGAAPAAGDVVQPGVGAMAESAAEAATGVPEALPPVGVGPPAPPPTFGARMLQGGQEMFAGRGKEVGKVLTGVASGAGGAAVANMMAGSTKPAAVPQMPRGTDSGAAAAAAERERLRQRKGRGATVLSGPLGVTRPASVGAKVLLGQ